MSFHSYGDNFDEVVKAPTEKIDDLISEYLDSLVKRGVKGVTQRAHLMGVERLFIMNDCIWHKTG